MAHNPITLDLLKTLDAIDQRGSFAAAAEALHRVPSALTYTIQKVEQDLGLKLFDRSGHRAKLTPAGRLVLDQGRLILRDIDSLANSAKQLADGWEPELTICIDTLFEPAQLFGLVQAFNAQHPDIRIQLSHGSLSGTWEQLLNNSANLIISESSVSPKVEGYNARTLAEMTMVFAVSKDHPLAKCDGVVSEEMIEDYPIITVPDSTLMATPLSRGWTRKNRTISVPNMTQKIAAQQAGLGVGYLPKHRIKTQLAEGSLVALPLASNKSDVVIAWRKGTPGPALQWFIDHIQAAQLGL